MTLFDTNQTTGIDTIENTGIRMTDGTTFSRSDHRIKQCVHF